MATSLDLDHLRTLVAISECGGFGKAAVTLHISQPALSQHIRLLERGLKRKLFVKDGRNMKFTVDGEQVLAEARQILAAHDSALARLQVQTEQVVVVGSSEHSADQVLPEMIRALHQAFPDVTTRFEIARSTTLIEGVTKGAVDFAFILASRGNEGGREIGRTPLHWYSAPSWTPRLERDAIPLVAFEEPCALRERAMASLGDAGHRVTVAGQSTTLEGVLAGVRAGLGVALLPNFGGTPDGLVRRDDLPEVGEAGLNLITRRGLDADIEATAIAAGEAFFTRRTLQIVDIPA
ncbi:LysR substrate-binding domain-containing protein [Aeromicrobium panaciterrae]|uniref:LysR substrate-binding domain-containing protein n=1 Tax=Aeromicrobium panaciterrae TaxID=363861 RepID=UPI0031D92D29